MSFVIIYVDDGGIIGTPVAIKEVIEALGNTFKVKSMGEMNKFVGCQIIDTPDKEGIWIHQPKLLNNLKINFEEILEDTTRVFKTPSAPKTIYKGRRPTNFARTTETVLNGSRYATLSCQALTPRYLQLS
jgi:hypothetical protein